MYFIAFCLGRVRYIFHISPRALFYFLCALIIIHSGGAVVLLHIVLGHALLTNSWLLVLECDFGLMRETGIHWPPLPFQEDSLNFCEARVVSPTTNCLLVMLFLQDVVFTPS